MVGKKSCCSPTYFPPHSSVSCSSISVAYLNAMAIASIPAASASLPTACQIDLKELVCSSVYLQCKPGVDLANYATWNFGLYGVSHPVPFIRPCKSQCTALQSSCLGIPEVMGTAANCSAVFDYTFGTANLTNPLQYDPANDATCTTVTTPPAVAFGGASEGYRAYAGGAPGVCSTYVPSMQKIFIPPSQSPQIGLAPMTRAYAVQIGIETQLAGILSTLPVWVSPSCHNALSKYICMQGFLDAEMKNITQVLTDNGVSSAMQAGIKAQLDAVIGNSAPMLGSPFYVPKYPAREVCTSYATECAGLIAAVAATMPDMVPHCDMDVPGYPGVKFWQDTEIATVATLPMGALGTYNVISTRNNPPGEETTFETDCPPGFTAPTEIDDRTTMIPATNCAINCISPLFSLDEWDRFWQILRRASVAGVTLNVISLSVHLFLGDFKEEALVIAFILFAMLESVWGIAMFSIEPEERLCYDATRVLDARDGGTMCAMQSVVQVYSVIGMTLCLAFEAVNWCVLDDNRGFGDDPVKVEGSSSWTIRWRQLLAAVTLPIIPVIILLALGLQGYARNTMICFFNWRTGDQDLGVFFVWFFILVMIALFCSFLTIKQELSGKYHTKGKLGVSLHIIFVLFFSIVWGLASISRFNNDKPMRDLQHHGVVWATCVFQNYDGTDSYVAICGESPNGRPSKAAVEYATVTLFVASLFVSVIVFPSTVALLYNRVTGQTAKDTGKVTPVPTTTKVPVTVEFVKTEANEANV